MLDIQCVSSNSDPFGRVDEGYIKLRGLTMAMSFAVDDKIHSIGKLRIVKPASSPPASRAPASDPSASGPPSSNRKFLSALEIRSKDKKVDERKGKKRDETEDCFVCIGAYEDMVEAKGKEVLCLNIMSDKTRGMHNQFASGLILMPLQEKPGYFRRAGCSSMLAKNFKNAQMMDVTIV